MAGRSPADAVNAFLEPLGEAISCVTQTVLNVSGGYSATDQVHALTLGDGAPVELRGEYSMTLLLRQKYRIVEDEGERGPWKVQTAAYAYTLERPDAGELLAFHWHPHGSSTQTRPHLHIGRGAEAAFEPLVGAHLPTGRVAIEQVLRVAISELGVEPVREDWDDVLSRSQEKHETWRTWHGAP